MSENIENDIAAVCAKGRHYVDALGDLVEAPLLNADRRRLLKDIFLLLLRLNEVIDANQALINASQTMEPSPFTMPRDEAREVVRS